MNIKNLINELIEYGFSTDAATALQNRFPSHNSAEIHYIANEGSKEELMKLCESDSDLFDREKDEFMPVTWDYIEKKYEILELSNGDFVLISSWQQ
ncbi:MAG TPA: hypothetical protein VJ861_11310 [Treponemataceae bacterium]|nr:hypothetical protein [Treponemataceae bacterium]